MKKNIFLISLFVLSYSYSLQAQIKSKLDSVSYFIGVNDAKEILKGLNKPLPSGDLLNRKIVIEGIIDVLNEEKIKSSLSEEEMNVFIVNYFKSLTDKKNKEKLIESKEYLEKNKTRNGVHTTSSGLQYEVLNEGDGAIPTIKDKVKVDYEGKLVDGTIFDSSIARNQPIEFNINQVIKGWQEALQLMPVGSTWIITVPSELAYGHNDYSSIPGNSTLIFKLHLIEIISQ